MQAKKYGVPFFCSAEVFEWAGTAEAQLVLKDFAAGAPYARASEEARLALERTSKASKR